MIYETAVVARAEIGDDKLAAIKSIVSDLVQEYNGEILVNDDWGIRTFPQVMTGGQSRGHYIYFMYKADTKANLELERRLGIREEILRSMIVKLGADVQQAELVKSYKSPFLR